MKREYSIKKTTKEQRQEYVNNALALSTLDAPEPTPKTMELIEQYIDGNMELEDIKKAIIQRYKENDYNIKIQ